MEGFEMGMKPFTFADVPPHRSKPLLTRRNLIDYLSTFELGTEFDCEMIAREFANVSNKDGYVPLRYTARVFRLLGTLSMHYDIRTWGTGRYRIGHSAGVA
jgi:hypothetical protein